MRDLSRAHRREELAPRSVAFLAALPPIRELDTPLGLLLLCHGVGEDDMQRLRPDDDGYALASNDALAALLDAGRHALVVGGHTRERMVRRFGRLGFVNAGTLARDATPCCGVLDCEARRVRFFDLEDPSVPSPAEDLALDQGATR